ncbi:hypothetical protein CHS0354_000654 [Potamilus streckersoni]|uniref:AAA-ATPase-like domain-containing protein n=1 Tax=Potamilus streckersoni TaxID=2493646 RepID=A0AAE0T738_9BIVA|nr:hypothetical protein CHS0354_000654 [Potamilus streckersoni]
MKLLSIGIQHFETLRKSNRVYVDKTDLIFKLMLNEGVYFLSRPRRFGKSLLLSTMEQLALGRKDLFKDLWIEDKWDWTRKYPVIRISFTSVPYQTNGLEYGMIQTLKSLFQQFKIDFISTNDVKELFCYLLKEVHAKHGKIVLLIDEYDKPIIDFLEEKHIETATENQAIMKNFYSCLKDNGHFIHTLLITGISKFPRVSIFSELNHLDDLTLDPAYVNLLGYTQEELEKYFDEHLDFYLTKHNKETKQGLLDKIRLWYNGFSWDGENRVYNPFSILNFFQKNTFANYWFVSGTPTFLLRLMFEKKNYEFENVSFNVNSNNIYDIHKLELIPILFQTGYLTITEVKEIRDNKKQFKLNYPNKEVRDSFYDFIINSNCFTDGADKQFVNRLADGFMGNNLDEVEEVIDEMFKDVPHDFYVKQEVVLHCAYAKGRLDAVVETKSHVYIFEFKINKTVNEAIKQIRQKEYGLKYAKTKKQLIGIGANYSTKKRCFDKWKRISCFERAQRSFERAQRSFERAQRSFERAQRSFERAQRSFERAQRSFERAQSGFERAQRSFERAQRSFERAQRSFGESQERFLHAAGKIIDTMTANAGLFPNLPVSLVQVKAERDDYAKALDSSAHAGKTGEIHQTRKALEESLQKNGNYVNELANGDEVILEKSGYPMEKSHTKYGPLPPLQKAVFKNGAVSGSIEFDLEAMDGCFGYLISSTLANSAEADPRRWQTDWHSTHRGMLKGFERGKEYKFAVAAVGASAEVEWLFVGSTLFVN